MVEARKIGLDLERKELEQDLNHKAVATQIESHLYTVHTAARGEIRRTTSYIETESGHMTIKSSSCFVATTAYGDRNHPDVVLLRKFRDEVPPGVWRVEVSLIGIGSGPYLARGISHSPHLRSGSRWLISCLASLIRKHF